jgi:hypothetical protein
VTRRFLRDNALSLTRADEEAVGVGEPRPQRSGIISALYGDERPMCRPFIEMAATISVSNCSNETCPPSSVGRAYPW